MFFFFACSFLHIFSSTVSSENEPETPLSIGMASLLVSFYLTFISPTKYSCICQKLKKIKNSWFKKINQFWSTQTTVSNNFYHFTIENLMGPTIYNIYNLLCFLYLVNVVIQVPWHYSILICSMKIWKYKKIIVQCYIWFDRKKLYLIPYDIFLMIIDQNEIIQNSVFFYTKMIKLKMQINLIS